MWKEFCNPERMTLWRAFVMAVVLIGSVVGAFGAVIFMTALLFKIHWGLLVGAILVGAITWLANDWKNMYNNTAEIVEFRSVNWRRNDTKDS